MANLREIKLKHGIAHELTYYINSKRFRDYFPASVSKKYVLAEKLKIEREILLQKTRNKNIDLPIITIKINLGQFPAWYRTIRQTNPDDNCAESTLNRYILSLKTFAKVIGESYPLFKITTQHVQQFKTRQLHAGKKPPGINMDLRHLSHPFKLAHQHGLIPVVPQVVKIKVYKSLPDFLMPEELNKLFTFLPQGEVSLACHIMKWTGVRRSELVERCCKKDFNFNSGYLLIHGKNQEDRTIPLHPKLREYLKTNNIFNSKEPNEKLFTIKKHSISDGIAKAKKRANINKRGRTHLLRHSLGTNLINAGYDIKEVQYILGHKTLYMTNLYTQMIDSIIQKKFENFNY